MKRLTDKEWKRTELFQRLHREDVLRRLWELENGFDSGKYVELPCAVGTKVYEIRKVCSGTKKKTNWEEGYRPLTEILTVCPHYNPSFYGSDEECLYEADERDWDERALCSFNLDICCEECMDRLVVWETEFSLGALHKVYGTEQFDKGTSLCDTLFLTKEEAEAKLRELKGEKE